MSLFCSTGGRVGIVNVNVNMCVRAEARRAAVRSSQYVMSSLGTTSPFPLTPLPHSSFLFLTLSSSVGTFLLLFLPSPAYFSLGMETKISAAVSASAPSPVIVVGRGAVTPWCCVAMRLSVCDTAPSPILYARGNVIPLLCCQLAFSAR